MTSTKAEKRLELIAQLLAKAESTTPEEAEALTEHAERLMIKYGIEQAVVDDRRARTGNGGEQIVQLSIVFEGVYAKELVQLGAHVALALGTSRPLRSRNPLGREVLYLVGYEPDVAQAEILVRSLHLQSIVAMRAWWAEHRTLYLRGSAHDKRRARNGFIRGFGVGAHSRISENRQKAIRDAGTGTELVLVSRSQRVDEHANALTNRTARKPGKTDSHGFANGYRSGLEANTGERIVAQ